MAKQKKILGLDIGTTKIACAIAEVDNMGKYDILGLSVSKAEGFRNGVVINLETAIESVAQTIDNAEKMANTTAKNCSIFIGISGEYVKHLTSIGTIPVKNPSKGITKRDVSEVIHQAQTIRLPNDEQIIHLIPIQFTVDGQKGIKNPFGMFGFRLEVEALLIIGTVTAIENIHRVLDNLELAAESLVLQPQAIALAVAEPEDKDLGVAIIDIGGNTNISIFKDGALRFYKMLPIGGENITKDISIGLRTPYKKAEEIKKQYGTATINYVEHDQPIIIEDISGRESKQITQRLLSSIIEPRVEEILQHVEMTIRNTSYADSLSGGIILTGGTSKLKGIDILAEQIFHLPVKIGSIRSNGQKQSQVLDQNYTTTVGLIRYGLTENVLYTKSTEGAFSTFTSKIKKLFT